MLQHCPDKLETKLRNQESWAGFEYAGSVVGLLVLIQDLQYNKTNRKRIIMATVTTDFDLYSCAQLLSQTTDSYYKVFTSTVDTINSNGGQAGLHSVVYHRHHKVLRAKEVEKADAVVKDMTPDEVIDLEERTSTAARESAVAYLAYLYLLLADANRYGPFKT